MTKSYLWASALPLVACTFLSGCIDNNYDLSDIDTTSKIAVKDLVIPVNLEPVKLNSIIKIDTDGDGAIVEEDYTGPLPELQGKKVYVFRHSGTFNSDPIHINSFHVNSPGDLTPTEVEISIAQALSNRKRVPGFPTLDPIKYDIKHVDKTFTYHIENIDAKVESVSSISTPEVLFTTTLTIPANVMSDIDEIQIDNLRMYFPKGLTLKSGASAEVLIDGKPGYGTYDPSTGEVKMSKYTVKGTDKWTLALRAQNIDVADTGATLSNHTFDYTGHIIVDGGVLYIVPAEGKIPATNFFITNSYSLTSFDIEDFSGKINYTIDDFDFDDVTLNDIPDFLDQPDTRIRIANPQLYLSFYNTCAQYNLGGHAGLAITPVRKGVSGTTYTMDDTIIIGADPNTNPYKYAISPEGTSLTPVAEYANAEKLLFTDFGDVLYGDGIPSALKVDFNHPAVDGTAKNFPLRLPNASAGEGDIPPVHGSYEFRAPLALSDGSVIGYSGTSDDWDSEELEDLHIQYLEVSADATSTIPLNVELSAQLLKTINGESVAIGYCHPVVLPAMTPDSPIKILITYKQDPSADDLKDASQESQWLSGIDGIKYWVTATSTDGQVAPLSPDQTITLKNLKAKVNGYYLHKDEDFEHLYE